MVTKVNKEDVLEIKKGINQAKIVSFDLYDTLIFRKFEQPQDVFRFMGFITGVDHFAEIRMRMQRKAYHYVKNKYGYPHPTLHEIYLLIEKKYPNMRNGYESLEREIEQNAVTANRSMQELYLYAKKKGKKIIISTDMYLQKCDIEKILHKCGYEEFHSLYLSSERRRTKYGGDLYLQIIQEEKVEPADIFHIGDNRLSDTEVPRRLGIKAFCYDKREKDCLDSLYRSVHTNRKALLAAESFWYGLGYYIGGTFYMGLTAWIRAKAQEHKVNCLSRDGYNLSMILTNFGLNKCEYIHVSRRALLLPSIVSLGTRELELLPPYSCGQTVREVLRYLNFEQIPEEDFIAEGFSGYGAVIRTKRDVAKVKKIYMKNKDYILQRCEAERNCLEKYFQVHGLFDREMIFFDSGWNGTSQYLMERIYQILGKKCVIRFLYAGVKENSKRLKWLCNSQYDAFMNEYMKPGTQKAVLDSAAVMELFFSENAPALISYGSRQLQFEPYHQNKKIDRINQGIWDYMEQNRYMVRDEWMDGLQKYALVRIEELLIHPTAEQAKKIGDIENADSMSACKDMKKYIARIPWQSLKKNPFLDIFWEHGVYRHPDNCFGAKLFVFVRQRIAHLKGSR